MRLEEIMAASDQKEVTEEAQISLEQVERLVNVVDDLLARSRQADGGTTEPVRLIEIVRQQENEWGPAYEAADRELVFNVADDVLLLASPVALAQVIPTLIEDTLHHR